MGLCSCRGGNTIPSFRPFLLLLSELVLWACKFSVLPRWYDLKRGRVTALLACTILYEWPKHSFQTWDCEKGPCSLAATSSGVLILLFTLGLLPRTLTWISVWTTQQSLEPSVSKGTSVISFWPAVQTLTICGLRTLEAAAATDDSVTPKACCWFAGVCLHSGLCSTLIPVQQIFPANLLSCFVPENCFCPSFCRFYCSRIFFERLFKIIWKGIWESSGDSPPFLHHLDSTPKIYL